MMDTKAETIHCHRYYFWAEHRAKTGSLVLGETQEVGLYQLLLQKLRLWIMSCPNQFPHILRKGKQIEYV